MAALPRPVSYWFPVPGAHDDSALPALRASFIDGPGRRGHEAIHVLTADIKEQLPNHPPVVILSNYGEPAMMDRGFSLGALEYLVKSRVTPASVSQSIRGWIEQARQGRSEPQN
jgi:DNA-binding NarL/FixJ family response regulator